ncbi:MAG: hypothetical protein ACUVUG_05530 [Candidatus Aminicenantia bacterium]
MARPLRIEIEGGVYYVFSKAIERKHLFKDRKDFLMFVSFLKESKERFGLIIYAYALIRDSYYLVIETPIGNLSRAMHYLNTTYTVYYNNKYSRNGPLFRGRYKSYIVDKETFLPELTRYIHLIPYLEGESKRPQRYPYSSLSDYLHPKKDEFIDVMAVLNFFSRRKRDAMKKYKEFIEEGIRGKLVNPLDFVSGRTVIGAPEFAEELKNKIWKGKEKILIEKMIEPEKIIEIVCRFFRTGFSELKKRRKKDFRRQSLIFLLSRKSGLKLQDIGELFGIGYSAVSQSINKFKQELEQDRELARNFKLLEERISRIR